MDNTIDTRTGHKSHLSIRLIRRNNITKAGFEVWGVKQRRFISKYPYTFGRETICFSKKYNNLLHISHLANDQAIIELVARYFDEGTIYIYGYSHGKTRTRVKQVCICKVELHGQDPPQGKVIKTIKNSNGRSVNRLSRYFFYKQDRRDKV